MSPAITQKTFHQCQGCVFAGQCSIQCSPLTFLRPCVENGFTSPGSRLMVDIKFETKLKCTSFYHPTPAHSISMAILDLRCHGEFHMIAAAPRLPSRSLHPVPSRTRAIRVRMVSCRQKQNKTCREPCAETGFSRI